MADALLDGERRVFMTGNETVAWAALAAGADIMYGYPITPQNEIMHYWTRLAPERGRKFLQTEDEISAGFTTLGGVFSGARAFTATSGPGNVLMQESANMAEMMRVPIVYIIQQRGGPSTATVIYGQQETTLTCFGGNGEGHRIVYSPATHQDLFDYTIKAFQMAWTYRFPTFVMGDGYQAKMRESLTIYRPEDRGVKLAPATPIVADLKRPGRPAVHLRNCLNTEEELWDILQAHQADYDKMAPQVEEWDARGCDDAAVVIVSHGVVARAALNAYEKLRAEGGKVGYFRPVTVRPFPAAALKKSIRAARKILLAESSYGQLLHMTQSNLYGETVEIAPLLRPGVGITSEEIYNAVLKLL